MPHSGFGYPLYGFSYPNPLWPFSSTNTHGVRSSKLFSFPTIRMTFLSTPCTLALPYKTFQLHIGASALSAHRKSRAPICFQRIRLNRDLCSLELSSLSGFLSCRTDEKSISLYSSALSTFKPDNLTIIFFWALRALSPTCSAFSFFKDANLYDLHANLSPAYS